MLDETFALLQGCLLKIAKLFYSERFCEGCAKDTILIN